AFQRLAAGPVDRLAARGARLAPFVRDHARGEIIDLFETVAPRDGKFARAPEIFERRLRGAPAPPAAFALVLEIARGERAFLANAGAHIADRLFGLGAEALAPA